MKPFHPTLILATLLALSAQLVAQDAGYREPERRSRNNRAAAQQETQPAADASSYTSDDTTSAAARISSMATLDNTYTLGAGDRISLRIVEDRDKVLSLVIQDSGDIQAPYIGLVRAAGRTCKDVAMFMKRELERQYFQQATVIVALERRAPTRGFGYTTDDMGFITIYGQVARAGRYELAPDEELSISQAILRAGGFAQFANTKKVTIIRRIPGGRSVNILVNVDDIMRKGRMEKDLPIRPDDVIIVTEKVVNF